MPAPFPVGLVDDGCRRQAGRLQERAERMAVEAPVAPSRTSWSWVRWLPWMSLLLVGAVVAVLVTLVLQEDEVTAVGYPSEPMYGLAEIIWPED